MAKKQPAPDPKPRRIIVEERSGQWTAWFEDAPGTGFGGDSPGTSVDRLWGWWIATEEALASNQSEAGA
jgi:hypothetical protein